MMSSTMEKILSSQASNWREGRRLRAFELKEQGWKQKQIAEALDAPDLNPEEGIWKHLKCVELKNLCCESLAELKVELRKAKERLRHKRDVILGCIRQPGFEV